MRSITTARIMCNFASVLDTVEKQSDLGRLAGFGACTLGYHVALESSAFLQGNVDVLPLDLDLGIDGIADLCATSIDFAD